MKIIKILITTYCSIQQSIILNKYFIYMQIKCESDFAKCPEGGCTRRCNADLQCGHSCTRICHILDREHNEFKCKEKCIKTCPNDHPCPLDCYQGCGPCRVMVERELKCGHTVKMACWMKEDEFECYVEVRVKLYVEL